MATAVLTPAEELEVQLDIREGLRSQLRATQDKINELRASIREQEYKPLPPEAPKCDIIRIMSYGRVTHCRHKARIEGRCLMHLDKPSPFDRRPRSTIPIQDPRGLLPADWTL